MEDPQMIDISNLNLTAILVATLVSFMLGGLWYCMLFSKAWMVALGINQEDVDDANISMGRALGASAFASLLTAGALGLLLSSATPITWTFGIEVALLVWVAFSIGPMFKMVFWEERPWALFAIDGGYELVSILASAAILIAWS